MGGGIVVGAYRGPRSYDLAQRHMRCITGVIVVPLDISSLPDALRAIIMAELRDTLPPEIAEDISIDDWNDDDVTPGVVDAELGVDDLDDPG